jgi:nitroreductase
MEVLEAIKTRRSIRHYKPDPVSDEDLQSVLEAARWAPSWANTQCWRFILIRNNKTKVALASTFSKMKREGTLHDNPATGAVLQAPLVIVACAKLHRSGCLANGSPATDKNEWFMYDVALAMQNLALAAHSLGLGTVHIGALDARKAAEILDVPEGYCVVAMTPLGYPEREGKAPPRKELSEIVAHDKWGK